MNCNFEKNCSKFNFSYESGALSESFSDIFGFMIEQYAEGGVSDWIYGEESGGTTRSYSNPKSDGYHYIDSLYFPPKYFGGKYSNTTWIKYYGSLNSDMATKVIETNDGYMLAGKNRQFTCFATYMAGKNR